MSAVSPKGTYAVQPWQPLLGGFDPMELMARSFWQSRAGLPRPPQLTDLAALARSIRFTPTTTEEIPQ